MTIRQKIKAWLHRRPYGKQGWRTCPYCESCDKDCFWCGGAHQYYQHAEFSPSRAERLCPHCWLDEGLNARFCRFCGRHEYYHEYWSDWSGGEWELVWNVKEAGLLPALIWWHRFSERKRVDLLGHDATYGEILDLYNQLRK